MRRPSLKLLRPTLVLLVAFGLRAHRLALDSVWWDEGFSVYMARMPLHFMAAATARDAHPPVYYAMLHIWRGLAGEEEFALRLPSVFCGLLVVALTYRLGREVGGPGCWARS
jgi:4-amino-4-deoxy-L-arabinose transferase-like glycosyltransferase